MREGIALFICFLFLSLNAYAGQYEGLTPGVSSKADADQVFGRSIRYDSKNDLFYYSPEGHDLKALSIRLDDDNIIDRIHLLFQEPYSAEQIREWFNLPTNPTDTEKANGRYVEIYKEEGIKIVFQGQNNKSNIVQLSHVDVSSLDKGSNRSFKAADPRDDCPASAEKYAQQADPYIANDQYKKAIPHLEKAAMCDPKRAIYSTMLGFAYLKTDQLNKAIDTAKKVVRGNEDYISYSVLGTAYFRQKKWKSAIPYLEKAIKFKQDRKLKDNLEFLGVSYYNEGRLEEALTAMAKSYKRKKSPLNTYYIALISDKLGEKGDARYYYKKYLAFKHDNADMNSAAKERLSVLNSQTKQKSKHSLSDIIGVFKKEMNDFNSE